MTSQCVAQVWPRDDPYHPHRCSRAATHGLVTTGDRLCRQHLDKVVRHGVVKHYKDGHRIEKGGQ